jgi:4-hydroxybenzoate polyprenyltransferase
VGRVRQYVTLIRPYGILFIGFMPVFGAMCNGEFDLFHLSVLLVIGLLAHVFTFVQNDYVDVEVDRQSKNVAGRPLITGGVPRHHALILFLSSLILSLGLAVVFLFSVRSLIFLLLSFLFVTLYNSYSKRFPGMEFVLGLGVFTYGLFGGYTVSDTISPLVIIISLIGFFQWVFSVGVSANLKDVESDERLGIRTTPIVFGVRAADNTLKKPTGFILYAYSVKILHLLVASLPFILGYTSILIARLPIPILSYVLIAGVLLFTTYKILNASLEKRDMMLRYEGIHEGFALLLFPVTLLSFLIEHAGILPVLLLLLVIVIWPLVSLRTVFGKTLIPLE